MRFVSVIANLWRLESTGIFCTNDIMYHSLWCHLSSLPYQFLIFEDMGDWQPSPGVGNLPTLGPRTPRLFTGTWFLTWTTKDKQLGFLQRTNYYFLIVRSRVGNVSQARIFWLLHIRNAVSNPNPLCNGWELLQYTVLIRVIQEFEHSPSTFCRHRRVHCTCIWLFKCPFPRDFPSEKNKTMPGEGHGCSWIWLIHKAAQVKRWTTLSHLKYMYSLHLLKPLSSPQCWFTYYLANRKFSTLGKKKK